MIQTILIFALGFLAAVLLALAVAPAIWRRAVLLTRKRIESSLPLSINELNAEKDALRAEHAMEVRRLEMRLDKLRDADARHMANISDQAGQIKELDQHLADAMARAAKLEDEVAELGESLDERTTALSETTILLESTRAELETTKGELYKARKSAEAATQRADDDRKQLVDRDALVASLTANLADLKMVRKDLQRQLRELKAETKTSGEMLGAQRRKFAKTEEKLETLIGLKSDLETRIERREKELERAHDRAARAEAEAREMDDRIRDVERERHALEKEVAEMTLRTNRLMAAFGEKDPEKALDDMSGKIAKKDAEIKKLLTQRDDLKKALQAAGAKGGDGSGETVLREKLNQLAAEVVAMAARIEGPDSRINAILRQDSGQTVGDVVSLAERIRELQRKAEARRA